MTASELDTATQELLAAHPDGQRLKLSTFSQTFPQIAEQLRQCVDSSVLDLWGWSKNIDENTKTTIVEPRILSAIGRLAKTTIRKQHGVYHAGLLHTYGYLLSLIETPYGRKRERWLKGRIERGLGLPEETISAYPKAGTLLHNLSYVLCKIVFRNDETELKRCESFVVDVAPSLRNVDVSRLPIQRIVEEVKYWFTLCTDIVTLHECPPILIYSVQIRDEVPKLITCFPISDENVAEQLRPELFGDGLIIEPRYNAWLPWPKHCQLIGKRTLQH